MSSATKKFALATLTTPVLAALAIGIAGSAAAAPTGPQPSVPASADDPYTISVPIQIHIRTRAPKKDINDDHHTRPEIIGTTEPQSTSETVRTPKRTTRGAATRAPKKGYSAPGVL